MNASQRLALARQAGIQPGVAVSASSTALTVRTSADGEKQPAHGAVVIVRWGLATLPGVLDEISISRPLLISTERWRHAQLPVPDRFHGVRAHAEIGGVTAAHEAAGGRSPPLT
jgi:hypothetical protein